MRIAVVRLVPHVPCKNARVVGECAHHAFDVTFEARILRWVGENFSARRLHPAGVVHAGNRRMLRSKLWVRIPARIEKDKHWPYVVTGCDGEEFVDAVLEALRILLPEQVVQKHAHRVHADALSPAQFAVNRSWIKSISLPHLQLINGSRWQKIRAHRPWLFLIPRIGLRLGPARLLGRHWQT